MYIGAVAVLPTYVELSLTVLGPLERRCGRFRVLRRGLTHSWQVARRKQKRKAGAARGTCARFRHNRGVGLTRLLRL